MTIDEAIEQFKYDAKCNRADLDLSYAEHNEQIAEWLEELKKYKEKPEGYLWDEAEMKGYNKAIDDFADKLKQDVMTITFGLRICDIARIAEQLKEGANNGTDNQ